MPIHAYLIFLQVLYLIRLEKGVMRKLPCVIAALALSASVATPCLAATDFSFLDGMSKDELREVQKEVLSRLGQTEDVEEVSGTEEATDEKIPVYWNSPIETDDYNFTLTGASWDYDLLPPDTSSVYSYREGTEGKTFLVIRGQFESTYTEMFRLDDYSKVSFTINDKYEFDGYVFTSGLNGNRIETLSYIDPFETVNVYLVAQVPDKLLAECKTIECIWSFAKDFTSDSYDFRVGKSNTVGAEYIVSWEI